MAGSACADGRSSTPSPNRAAGGPTESIVAAGPPAFGKTICKPRNEVERTINALKRFRDVATRFGKRAYVFQGTVTVVAIRLWLRA